MTPPTTDTLAAIDVGTHSVHMVIARLMPGGSPKILAREHKPVRLGAGGGESMQQLESAAIDRTVATLAEFRHIADAHRAKVVAVATSAVREADNASDFLYKANNEARVSVEVISSMEEARLIHLGALSAVPIANRRHLVIDIGGGSTEMITADDTEPTLIRSIKLGHIRLTDRFFPGGVVEPSAVDACNRYIKSVVAPVATQVRQIGFEVAAGCSGTIAAVAMINAGLHGRQLLTPANAVMTRTDIDEVTADLVSRRHPEDRSKVPGLNPKRRDVIVAGAVLLRQLVKQLGVQELTVSSGALREGLLTDRFSQHSEDSNGRLRHLSDLRHSSVLALARSHQEDLAHAEHVTKLALDLFDATMPAHRLNRSDRMTLEAAGLLHNIGRFVAHSGHHKHSYYLIRHSERLAGFTDNELELIALVARYHRKRKPVESHTKWAALNKPDQHRVRVLAGLLRVGIALDRTYRRAVNRVRATVDEDAMRVNVEPAGGISTHIEMFTARSNCDLLAEALGRDVFFQEVDSQTVEQPHERAGSTGRLTPPPPHRAEHARQPHERAGSTGRLTPPPPHRAEHARQPHERAGSTGRLTD